MQELVFIDQPKEVILECGMQDLFQFPTPVRLPQSFPTQLFQWEIFSNLAVRSDISN